MSALEVFDGNGWTVRAFAQDGEPWFVARDVCDALLIANSRDALAALDEDEKGVGSTDTPGGVQQVAIVNEAGLYGLILRSRKREAKEFRRWVTHEVLPALRKTGQYVVPQQMPSHSEALRGWAEAIDRTGELERQLEVAGPKVAMVDQLLSSAGDYSLREAAQLLDSDPSISIGRNQLLGYLIEVAWVDKLGKLPYQRTIQAGRLRVRTSSWDHPTQGPKVSTSVRVTPKGLAELHKLLGGTAPVAVRVQS